MIPVYQKTKKDCLKACLASLLEIDIDIVPLFIEPNVWFVQLNNWLYSIKKELIVADVSNAETYCIGVGESPRGDWHHAVIIDKDLNVVHDPFIGRPLGKLLYVMVLKDV